MLHPSVRAVTGSLILALTALVPALTQPASAGTKQFASEQLWGTASDNNWEPTVATDPSSNYVYQVTTYVKTNPHLILFRSSADGGSTWGPAKQLCPKSVSMCSRGWQADEHLAVAANGTVYATWMQNYKNPGVLVAHSTDHGQTWSTPVQASHAGNFRDEPQIAISPTGQDIYVTSNSNTHSFISCSHDYGATFTEVQVSNDGLWWYAWGHGVVLPSGEVMFVFDRETGSISRQYTEILSSADGGKTWSHQLIGTSQAPPPCIGSVGCGNYNDFWGDHPAIARNPYDGTLMVVYEANTSAHAAMTLYERTSTNGTTWSAPVTVNNQGSSSFSQVAAGTSAGDFRLVWQDNRNGQKSWNTWYTQTLDNGSTWSPQVRLSDQGQGAPCKTSSGYCWPYGDYLGLAVSNAGVNYVIWGEGTGLYTGGGSWFTSGV